jgi:hypothetical protein
MITAFPPTWCPASTVAVILNGEVLDAVADRHPAHGPSVTGGG